MTLPPLTTIGQSLVDLRARPDSRRGPMYISDEELDKQLDEHGICWRSYEIERLENLANSYKTALRLDKMTADFKSEGIKVDE